MAGLPESRRDGSGWRNTSNRIPGGWCPQRLRNSDDPCAATPMHVVNAGNSLTDGEKRHSPGSPNPEARNFHGLKAWPPPHARPRAGESKAGIEEGGDGEGCPRSGTYRHRRGFRVHSLRAGTTRPTTRTLDSLFRLGRATRKVSSWWRICADDFDRKGPSIVREAKINKPPEPLPSSTAFTLHAAR